MGLLASRLQLLRSQGVARFARRAYLYLWKKVSLRLFDWRYNVRTRQLVMSVKDQSGPSAEHALYYEACDAGLVSRLLKELPADLAKFVFIDAGTGMGKPLFIAAEFPFQRIVGLELSPALAEAGRRNCATYSSPARACRNLEIVCGDALAYEFPQDPLVVFMYNPFHEPVMRPFIENLVHSIRTAPREVFVLYVNSRLSHVIDKTGEFQTIGSGRDETDYRRLKYAVWHHAASGISEIRGQAGQTSNRRSEEVCGPGVASDLR